VGSGDRNPLPTAFCPSPWPLLLTGLLLTIAKPDTIWPQSASGADRDLMLRAASLRSSTTNVIREFIEV
jgi:hypothetical protein